ncbi:MAG: hypothetical protein M0004_02680 [Actinomycetota bacterium]|nr:hypothetical protein [Actinomycetota bacterium]
MSFIEATTPINITPNTLANTMDTGLVADQTNLASLEQQISTGNAINQASDNPAGAAQLLRLQSGLTRANQYQANANDGIGWLTLANSTTTSILNQLQSVRSLVEGVSGNSLTGNASTLQTTADQVNAAMQNLINLANTTYAGGQPIFAGTGGQTSPAGATIAYQSDGTYVGSGNAPTRTVAPGTSIPVSVTGPDIFGSGASGLLGSSGILQSIICDLNGTAPPGSPSGTPPRSLSDLPGDYSNLQAALNNAEAAAGTLGAQQDSMQSFATQASDSVSALTQQLGNVQSTNMAEAITSLQLQQTSYQEALYATAQLSTDSLAKYL